MPFPAKNKRFWALQVFSRFTALIPLPFPSFFPPHFASLRASPSKFSQRFPQTKALDLSLFPLLLMGLASCTLRLEDPEADLRGKLGQGEGIDSSRIVGRFLGDSTYSLNDENATSLSGKTQIEFYPDGTFQVYDLTSLSFPSGNVGTFYTRSDTLHLNGTRKTLFIGDLSFLDHYLALYEPARLRFSFYHRKPTFTDSAWSDYLQGSRWHFAASRENLSSLRIIPTRASFSYWIFRGDSLLKETNTQGTRTLQSHSLSHEGNQFVSDTAYILEPLHRDTLRVWNISGGIPQTDFSIYVRKTKRLPFDFALNPFFGSFTADQAKRGAEPIRFHYGEFADFNFSSDHSLTLSTGSQTQTWPVYNRWSLDSGFFILASPQFQHRYRIEPAAIIQDSALKISHESADSLVLKTITGAPADQPSEWILKRINPETLANDPFSRHPTTGYLQLVEDFEDPVSPFATTHVYAYASGTRRLGNTYRWEALYRKESDSLWFALHLPGNAEIYASSASGFRFTYQGQREELGKFVCSSEAATPLTYRRSNPTNDHPWKGTLQGQCRITQSEKSPTDSMLNLTAQWRWDYQTQKTPQGPFP
jgi:hypothetical protein